MGTPDVPSGGEEIVPYCVVDSASGLWPVDSDLSCLAAPARGVSIPPEGSSDNEDSATVGMGYVLKSDGIHLNLELGPPFPLDFAGSTLGVAARFSRVLM